MQEEPDHHQVKTLYPFSRNDIFQMFKRKVNPRNQKLFDVEQSIDQIQKQLQSLKKIYEAWNLQVHPGDIDEKFKTMNRKIYGSFRCNQCRNNFTSILGNFQIRFSKKQNNNQFVFDCKIYRLQCKKCEKWCEGKIFQSQLQAVAKSFCLIIASILEDLPKPQKKDDRNKQRQVHFHKEQLCEACHQGKCFNIPKGQNYYVSNLSVTQNYKKKYSINKNYERSEEDSQESEKEEKICKVQKKQQTYAQYQQRKKLEKIARRTEMGLTKKKKPKKNNVQKHSQSNILQSQEKVNNNQDFKKVQNIQQTQLQSIQESRIQKKNSQQNKKGIFQSIKEFFKCFFSMNQVSYQE